MSAELQPWVEWTVAIAILVGAVFVLVGSIGLVKLEDFYMRLHGPTKATTLGAGGTILGSLIYFTAQRGSLSLHEVLITLFLFMTAPVSAHMIAKAAMHLKEKYRGDTRGSPWDQ
jgi:multicomponent K+:H+ antiporter subunit G